jgi:hypothetical protein
VEHPTGLEDATGPGISLCGPAGLSVLTGLGNVDELRSTAVQTGIACAYCVFEALSYMLYSCSAYSAAEPKQIVDNVSQLDDRSLFSVYGFHRSRGVFRRDLGR